MEDHVATEWKDPNPGHSSEDVQAGFEKHGLSVPLSPPREQEGPSLPLTPQSGQKTPGGSLAERRQARTGFKVPKLSMPFSTAAGAGADNSVSVSGAPSPYLTIPPGLSPASLLESPVFVSNAMGQPSPTTGKLFMSGGTNDNDPIRFGGLPVGDDPDAFSFKPLAHYTPVVLKEHNIKVSMITETAFRKKFTETKAQPVQEANLLGQLNQLNQNVQTNMNSGGPHDSKLSRLASGTGAGNEHLSPLDYGQTAEEGDAREDYPAMAATAVVTAEDGYSWRKYGQKQVKHSEYPRSYFKCTHPNCLVKKKVERSHEGHITEIVYKGAHNHPKPAPSRPRQAGVQQPVPQPFGDTAGAQQADAADNNLGSSQQANAAAEANHQAPRRVSVQDGVDATSSPSVPGELCDSAVSMKVEFAPRGFGSPEGADVTSAPSVEVDGDRVTLVHGGADADGTELESKRRKLESYAIDMSAVSRGVREPRVVIQTTSEMDILDDGYRWRKYGQKVVKGNPNPRSYYKCTHNGCTVRKHVERASHDLKSVITTYEGKHNHEVPAARNSGGHQGAAAAAVTGARSRPMHHPSVHDGLMMRHLGGCGLPFGLPPPRDPLACLASLPSLPMPPAGNISAVEGLKLPMLASDAAHEDLLLRRQRAMHQQAMQAAMVADMKVLQGNVAAGVTAAPSSVYQQMMRSGLRLGGHQM